MNKALLAARFKLAHAVLFRKYHGSINKVCNTLPGFDAKIRCQRFFPQQKLITVRKIDANTPCVHVVEQSDAAAVQVVKDHCIDGKIVFFKLKDIFVEQDLTALYGTELKLFYEESLGRDVCAAPRFVF